MDEWRSSPVETVRFAATDPDRATELFTGPFPGIELRAPRGAAGFSLAFEKVSDGRLSVNRLRVTGSGTGAGSIAGGVGIARVRAGRFDLDYGGARVDTSVPYLRPTGRSQAVMRDVHLQLIDLNPQSFTSAAYARLEGTGQVAHLPLIGATGPRAPELIPTWHGVADLVMSVAFDPSAFSSPLVRAGLFDMIVAASLATFPITTTVGEAGRFGAGPASLRRALAFIDEHLDEPVDVAAIAGAARVPVRTLQALFRAQLGVTPIEHLRLRRLAAARADLLVADPTSGASVSGVAHRWGFAHLARFAEQYRRTYHESPSDTLRQ